MVRKDVERIGIEQHGALCAPYLRNDDDGRVFLLPQSGTYAHGVHGVGVHRFVDEEFLVVVADDGFGHTDLQDVVVAARRVDGHFPHAGPEACLCGQNGGSRHAVAAGHDEGVAHVAFVGEGAAVGQKRPDVALFEHGELRLRFLQPLLAQADVERAKFAYELLVFGEEEGQFLVLKGQREVGFDDVCADVVSVVLGHQPRGNVDAHDVGRRLVDVFHQRCEAPCQRLVEARAEQPVHHEGLRFKLRRVELVGHLHKVFHFAAIGQPLLVGLAIFRQFVVDIEKIGAHIVVLLGQQTCRGQGIAAVVAGSGKNHDGGVNRKAVGNGTRDGLGGAFHQVNRTDGLVLYGVLVQLTNLGTCQNLHCFMECLLQRYNFFGIIAPLWR